MKKQPNMSIVCASGIFSGIPEDEVAKLLENFSARECEYDKGEIILQSGIKTNSLGVITSGEASITHEDFFGNSTFVSRLLPRQSFAEAFALSQNAETYVTVTAEKNCRVLWINALKITETGKKTTEAHITVLKNLLSDFAEKTLAVNEKVRHMSKRTTKQKLLSYLSACADKSSSNEFDIPLGRTKLADYLAVDRSAMTTELSKLKRDGVIDFSGRHFVLLNAAYH